MVSSTDTQLYSTPPSYPNTLRHSFQSPSSITSNERQPSSQLQTSSSAVYQTQMSSSINIHPLHSRVSSKVPIEVLPSALDFFHAFGTLEFHHLSGLHYTANGTLKVRAPVNSGILNSTSAVKQSIAPTPTRQRHSEHPSSTLSLHGATTTFLQNSMTSNGHAGSLMVPKTMMSSMPNMVTSTPVATTRK